MTGKDLIKVIEKEGLSDLPINMTADVYYPEYSNGEPRPIISFQKHVSPDGKSGTDIWLDAIDGSTIEYEWGCE